MFKGDYTIRAVDSELWDAIQAENEPQSTDIVDRLQGRDDRYSQRARRRSCSCPDTDTGRMRWIKVRKLSHFLLTSCAHWISEVLPGPPRSPMQTEISPFIANSSELAGDLCAHSVSASYRIARQESFQYLPALK
jgi:hypothetical protein